MCDSCGCGKNDHFHVHPGPDHASGHSHDSHDSHGHHHDHPPEDGWHSHAAEDGTLSWHRHGGAEQPILDANQRLAEQNRGFFRARGILAINLVSSPGSGKTTLLRATLERLHPRAGCAVVVGDLETDADAEALRPSGAPVVQITTGTVCHLDARMVASAVDTLPHDGVRLLFIENVGNLVCPASFDLGEAHRVVLLSCTEGENKPLKYPPIFHGARAVIISKTDLAGPAGFDISMAREAISRVAPDAEIIELSSRSGDGIDRWLDFLNRLLESTAKPA